MFSKDEPSGKRKNFANPFSIRIFKLVWFRILLPGFLLVGWGSLDSKTSTLGTPPKWELLDPWQSTMTRDQFERTLSEVYCPRKEWWKSWIVLEKDKARIRKQAGQDQWYHLFFCPKPKKLADPETKRTSLKGLKIALDPGHIGGKYSEMEGRHFVIGKDAPVKEGDLSLGIAKKLEKILTALGAEVFLVRDKNEPVTSKQPKDFAKEAQEWIAGRGLEKLKKEEKDKLIKKRQEMLFYRVSEIHARAKLINEKIRPDLVVCLHLNASPWKDPEKKELGETNDFHVLVNGCYMGGELALDDQRFEMLLRLLNGWHLLERKVAEDMSVALAKATRLPAFSYRGPNALKIGKVEGVWARNLLANRLYRCPVVFLEPYRANSKGAYERIIAGSYKGTREFKGAQRSPLLDEYARAVAEGLVRSFVKPDSNATLPTNRQPSF